MRSPDRGFTDLVLNDQVVAALHGVLPAVAEHTVAAVTVEVPSYADAFSGPMGQRIEGAVQMALGAFLRLAARSEGSDPGPTLSPALDGAYELGRGEARSGRSVDALLSAYRVGARVAWRELSESAVDGGLPPLNDREIRRIGFRVHRRALRGKRFRACRRTGFHRTGQGAVNSTDSRSTSLAGAPTETLQASADRADWHPPDTLTAVLLPSAQTRGLVSRFGQSTLQLGDDLPGIDGSESVVVLLIPDVHGPSRSRLLRELRDRRAIVGPARIWTQAHSSYHRVLQARELGLAGDTDTIDTDTHLVELVLGADREAADDLRRLALAPLDRLRPNTAERLAETLRSWLLHQGQRDAVAADLFVHAQTVRYRMTQLRELFGERLNDPRAVLELVVALSIPATIDSPAAS